MGTEGVENRDESGIKPGSGSWPCGRCEFIRTVEGFSANKFAPTGERQAFEQTPVLTSTAVSRLNRGSVVPARSAEGEDSSQEAAALLGVGQLVLVHHG
jgi:hypothetical protein